MKEEYELELETFRAKTSLIIQGMQISHEYGGKFLGCR